MKIIGILLIIGIVVLLYRAFEKRLRHRQTYINKGAEFGEVIFYSEIDDKTLAEARQYFYRKYKID